MRNQTLSFLSILTLVTGLLVALAAGPALAWSYPTRTTTQSTWKYPLWPGVQSGGATTGTTGTAPAATNTATNTASNATTNTATNTASTPAPAVGAPAPAPAPTAPATSQSAMEQQLLALLNQERVQSGLKPLALDADLSRVARMKAQDLVANNYFSHYSPTYGWPPEMVRKAGISYRYGVGENMVETTTAARMHMQLMNSPSHRANLLDPNYTHVGIGIVPDQYGAFMAVQEFIGR